MQIILSYDAAYILDVYSRRRPGYIGPRGIQCQIRQGRHQWAPNFLLGLRQIQRVPIGCLHNHMTWRLRL